LGDDGSSEYLDYPLPTCVRPWYLCPGPPATNPEEEIKTFSDYDSAVFQPEGGSGASRDQFASLDGEFQPDYEASDSDASPTGPVPSGGLHTSPMGPAMPAADGRRYTR
jgi:hypothetical protein